MSAEAPSPWVVRWAPLIAPGARVIDVACGSGRHSRHLAERGARVTAVDRNAEALAGLSDIAETRCLDLEQEGWPLAGETSDAVVVTNYLWRPHFEALLALLAPGGLLIYETFHRAHAAVGRPKSDAFLLQDGELLARCAGLRIHAYEQGWDAPRQRFVQRIVACRDDAEAPPRALCDSTVFTPT